MKINLLEGIEKLTRSSWSQMISTQNFPSPDLVICLAIFQPGVIPFWVLARVVMYQPKIVQSSPD